MNETSLIQLASIQSLSTLNEAINKLCKKIAILEDERNEYRRKWLEAVKDKECKYLEQ